MRKSNLCSVITDKIGIDKSKSKLLYAKKYAMCIKVSLIPFFNKIKYK